MADFNWGEYPQEKTEFDWNNYEVESPAPAPKKEAPGYLESAASGIAQAASGGFMDELTGAIRSPIGAAKEIANKFGAGYDDPEVRNYRATRDMVRGFDRDAQEANPGTFLAGNIAGSVASLPASAGANLARMAGVGAAQGIGLSDDESLGDIAQDAAFGGALGAGVGYGASKLPKAAEYLGDKVAGIGDRAKNVGASLGPKPPGADWVMQGDAWVRMPPAAQAKAQPLPKALSTAKDIALDYIPGGNIAAKLVGPKTIQKGTAVTFDKVGDILKSAPEKLGKFAATLQEAEMRGPAARATTHYILQQTQPEYRELVKELETDSD